MKRLILVCILAIASIQAFAQVENNPETIPPGSKVYIEPMDRFENYISAAFDKKKVPLYVVADRNQADFEIKGTAEVRKAGWAKTIFGTGRPAVNASIQVINIKTSIVAYSPAEAQRQVTDLVASLKQRHHPQAG